MEYEKTFVGHNQLIEVPKPKRIQHRIVNIKNHAEIKGME